MHPALRTGLCDRLGIRVPVVQAPMAGGWTSPQLVAAVSGSGGLGFLPAARTTVDALDAAVQAVRERTDAPFGVNFLLAPPEPAPAVVDAVQDVLDGIRADLGLPPGPRTLRLPPSVLEEQFERVTAARVPVISFGMGDPTAFVPRAHAAGATVLVMVTSVAEARIAEAAGADAIIAQGADAGGHRSTFLVDDDDTTLPQVGTFALVPQVVDDVSVPVIAAGGIMDGRGVAAALALGAQAVQLGTRFLLAHESGAYPAYRRMILEGTDTSTRITRRLTGRPARAFGNRLLEALEAADVAPLPWPWQAVAAEDLYRYAVQHGSGEVMALLAGQGLRMARREMDAAAIVTELVEEAGNVLRALGA